MLIFLNDSYGTTLSARSVHRGFFYLFYSPKHSIAAWYASLNRGPELILHCVKSIDQVCFSRKFDFWKGEHLPDTKLIDCFQIEHKEINFHIIFTMSKVGWGEVGWGGGVKRSQETFFVIKKNVSNRKIISRRVLIRIFRPAIKLEEWSHWGWLWKAHSRRPRLQVSVIWCMGIRMYRINGSEYFISVIMSVLKKCVGNYSFATLLDLISFTEEKVAMRTKNLYYFLFLFFCWFVCLFIF